MFQVFPGQLLGIDKWGLIIRPAYILQGLFLVDGVHVLVVVTLAGTGATLWTFPVVVWLSIWLCFHLLWKPPWQLPASVEFTDDGLHGVDDDDADEDYEPEAKDTVLAESTVQNATAPPALPKVAGRQLSKKELKQQVTAQFPWDPGGSELLHRLEGKPNLKKGGMSGTNRCWVLWAVVRAYPSLS
jgi:hypothetical protein